MTPIRRTVLVVSLLGMLIFGFLLFWTPSFYIRLIAFFFFFLSLFHVGLSAWVSITKLNARASDYFYFSIAALGLLIASVASSQDPEEYYAAVASTIGRPDVKQLASEFQAMAGWCEKIPWPSNIGGTISSWLYGDRLDEGTCSFAKRVSEILTQQNYSEVPNLLEKEGARQGQTQWESSLSLWWQTQILTHNPFERLWRFWQNPELLRNPLNQNLGYIVYLQIKFPLEASYYYSDAYTKGHQGIASERSLQIAASRYFYSALWPFLLALAISLRITRVTADVSDWPL
jgi:hypothetical protein